MCVRQNEYLFENAAICTRFGAIYYEMKGNMLQNAVRFAAKCSAFWCKMQAVLMLNAVQNAAKWKEKRHKNTLQWNK